MYFVVDMQLKDTLAKPQLTLNYDLIIPTQLAFEQTLQVLGQPLCAYMEEASCHSSCPLEAAEAPSLPGAHENVQLLLPKLRREIIVASPQQV